MHRPYDDVLIDVSFVGVDHETLAGALARRDWEKERAIEAILSGDYENVDVFDD